jgi:DNA repair exonuclease SbcCD ATPase subunit
MMSGRQTLASIDQALAGERGKLDVVEQRIADLSAGLVEGHKQNTQDYRALAKVRVGLLAGNEVLEHIDQAEQQVLALLRNREVAARELNERIQAAEAERTALETERAAQANEVDRAAEAVDEAQARTQARLDADPAYVAQRERAREAKRTAAHADEKAANSEQEQEQKGEAYRNDPLFMYLWDRDFGLPSYRASSLVRWLDGKVARVIGFADARANYARLSEIPQRLREHAERLTAAAESEFQALRDRDTEAQEADGIPALEGQLQEQQGRLDAIDQRIEAAEAEHQALLGRKAAFAAGDDEYTRNAVDYLAGELQRDDLMALRREALATPFPDDDQIVARMLQRDDERRRTEATIQGLKDTLEQHRTRLAEFEAVRGEFKRRRYDRAGSSFGESGLIALMLGNFLNGLLDRQALLKVLQEQHRYRPQRSDPTFGSGGFGRGTVWGGGAGDLRDLGDALGGLGRGRSGGLGGGLRRGGGFRTGGGF